MKKAISLLLTAIMVFSLVPALFVQDGFAADDQYVKNTSGGEINVYETSSESKVVGHLAAGAVAKYESNHGAFDKISNPAGFSIFRKAPLLLTYLATPPTGRVLTTWEASLASL